MLGQWEGVSQGFSMRVEGGRQIGGLVRGEGAQEPRGLFARMGWPVVVKEGSDARALQGWQLPEVQRRCAWQGALLVHLSPGLPGCEALFMLHMLFLQSREGSHPSAASHRWPSQPNTQALEGGMYGFSGSKVSEVRGVGGAGM